ncbi:uncharacterized protein LOC114718997 [Neltuma alba]|uniref:uncharacterized protein LOC114718997 n=1 Tax=Neltuma alba TaxID=207710 RepID=UPI0010A4DE45|nr:uncharacterized protein LOC114718997 [Prosopis alba]XP_028760284.1 uncharacterized protein LOC114718997 [Prosopis alba]
MWQGLCWKEYQSLGLQAKAIIESKAFDSGHQKCQVNLYPPCPQPDLTDNRLLTVFIENGIKGLQVKQHHKWVNIVSNKLYKSVWHRVVVNERDKRLSLALKNEPAPEKEIGPATELLEKEKPLFKRIKYKDYLRVQLEARCIDKRAPAAASLPSCCSLHQKPLNFHSNAHHQRNLTTLSLSTTHSKIPIRDFCALTLRNPRSFVNSNSNQSQSHSLFLHFLLSTDYKDPNNQHPERRYQKLPQEDEQKGFGSAEERRVHFTNMWWADVKAALGQRINLEAICSTFLFVKDPKLALPHVSVPDLRYIDWGELRRRGFKGVVFDKDNTITAPYSLTLWPPLASSMERCKSAFGPDIAVFSNSAGLHEYDHDGSKAKALEEAIGIRVIRHRVKKPAGSADEIEKHFGCEPSQLIMVGDRPFTDIVYGNRNGFLTILTEPLSLATEPFVVRQVRKLETSFVNHWRGRGLEPPCHKLLPDQMLCVEEPPPPQ